MTITRKDVLAAKALAEAVPSGPWDADQRPIRSGHWDTVIRTAKREPIALVCEYGWSWSQRGKHAAHIAASRTSVPALADALLEAVALLRECATLPSEFEDDRMSYVVVQMDKSLRDALRTLLAAFDAEGS